MSGLTRRYSREFRVALIEGDWVDENYVRFRVGDSYEAALRDQGDRLPTSRR